jgi:phage major head subunit gpT-like protein
MKTIERLRQLKAKAVERMKHLNDLATTEKRELSKAEQEEFDLEKVNAETYEADIVALSRTDPNPPAPAVIPPVVDQEALRAEGANRETARANSIRERCAAAKLPDAFALEMIASKKTLDEVTSEIFRKLSAPTDPNAPNPGPTGVGAGTDKRDKFKAQMEAALTIRANPNAPKEVAELGREFAGMTLFDMARECLDQAGVKTRGLSRDTIANIALKGVNGYAEYFSGGMMGTSDFPNILADVANKSLRQGYGAAPRTFTEFCRQVSAVDFKNINRVQLSDVPTLTAINEHGEFHRSSLTDSKETYALATYGEVIAITRKTIINDDLQALSRVPQGLGQAAANLESDTVWGVITANAALSDSVALFHATHSNLNLTNGLANAAMATMRAAFRLQTGPKGTILNLTPKFILAPAALEQALLQLLSMSLVPAVFTNVVPEWIRSLTPVIEPRLDANSTTTWYAAADPGVIDTIEYCYLEGQQGAFIESRNGFDVDGIEIKCRLDFGAAAIDYRGLAKNTA